MTSLSRFSATAARGPRAYWTHIDLGRSPTDAAASPASAQISTSCTNVPHGCSPGAAAAINLLSQARMIPGFSQASGERLNLIDRRVKVGKLPASPAPLFDLPDQGGQRSATHAKHRCRGTRTEAVDALCKHLELGAQPLLELAHECSIPRPSRRAAQLCSSGPQGSRTSVPTLSSDHSDPL